MAIGNPELPPNRNPLRYVTSLTEERSGSDEGAGGKILADVRAINLVELFVQGEVGTKDLHRDQVVHRHFGFVQSRLHSVEQESDLFLDIFGRFAGLRIDADPSRQIKSIADEHSITEGQCVRATREHDVSPGAGGGV